MSSSRTTVTTLRLDFTSRNTSGKLDRIRTGDILHVKQCPPQCLSVHVYTYTVMVTKTISITKEAYEALLREKTNKESFTDTILRITKKSGKIADCFGTWKMTDKEEAAIQAELSKGWRLVQERMSNEVP